MSGIGSIGSSSSTTSTLPNGGLSSVGASLQTTGQAPNAVTSSGTSSTGAKVSTYETEFENLQQYDDQELLYASFLSPEAGLANFDSVLEQAAQLLGTPGNPGPALTQSTPATTSTTPSSTSTASSAVSNLPSVASILAASDDEANQTLTAYANAPVGSSILDFQA